MNNLKQDSIILISETKEKIDIKFGNSDTGWNKYNIFCDKVVSILDTTSEDDGFNGQAGALTIVFIENDKVYKLVQVGGCSSPQYTDFMEKPIITELQEISTSEIKLVEEEEENEEIKDI